MRRQYNAISVQRTHHPTNAAPGRVSHSLTQAPQAADTNTTISRPRAPFDDKQPLHEGETTVCTARLRFAFDRSTRTSKRKTRLGFVFDRSTRTSKRKTQTDHRDSSSTHEVSRGVPQGAWVLQYCQLSEGATSYIGIPYYSTDRVMNYECSDAQAVRNVSSRSLAGSSDLAHLSFLRARASRHKTTARERAQRGGCETGLSLHTNGDSPVGTVGSRDEAPDLTAPHGSADTATRTVKPTVYRLYRPTRPAP